MKILKYVTTIIITITTIGICGCAGWDYEYDPIEDEITIETVEEER